MAVKTFYILANTASLPGYFSDLQDGGTNPAAATVAYGWTVGKVAAAYWRGRIGATTRATVSQASSWLTTPTTPVIGTNVTNVTAGDSFVTPTPLTGIFAAANWTANFGMRTGAATNVGRIRFQMYAGTSKDGVGARKIGSPIDGDVETMNSTTLTFTSNVTWNPGAITLNNEYLFFATEWQGTGTGTANNCSASFRQGESSIVTSDFAEAVPAGWSSVDKSSGITLSNGDKTATVNVAAVHGVHSTKSQWGGTAGRYYAEILCNTAISKLGLQLAAASEITTSPNGFTVASSGNIFDQGGQVVGNIGTALAPGDVLGIAWDSGTQTAWFRKNQEPWNNNASANPATGANGLSSGLGAAATCLWFQGTALNVSVTLRTELAEFTQGIPYSFSSWMGELQPALADAWSNVEKSPNFTLSNADKTVALTYSGTASVRSTRRNTNQTAGKWYAEWLLNVGASSAGAMGVQASNAALGSPGNVAIYVQAATGVVFVYSSTSDGTNIGDCFIGDVVSMAWDTGAELVWFRRNNGLWNGVAGADPATGVGGLSTAVAPATEHSLYYLAVTIGNGATVRTGAAELTQTVPDGYTSWIGETPVAGPTTGTGTLNSGAADLDATGKMASFAIGALQGTISALAGTGSAVTPGAGPWTPAELGPDLIAWYDFADSATVIQSGGFLTQWRDKSVNARHANAMSAGTLSINADGIYIANATSGPDLAIQMPSLPSARFDFAFAGKPNPFGSYRTLMAQITGGQHHMLIEVGTNNLGMYANSWVPAGSLTWPPVDGQVYFSGPDASNNKIGKDGGGLVDLSGEDFNPGAAPVLLNYNVGGGQGFGTAREFVFMTASRSQDIQDRVSGYLAWKWDGILGVTTHVAALPVGHPYKAAAPTTGAVSVIGSAVLDAARSEIIATGEAVSTTVTGTGALFQQGVSVSGVGTVALAPITGTGALVTVSTLAASGTARWIASGALVTSASATGAGISFSGGTAALAPAPAVLTGKQGDVLQAGDSTMLSYGVAQWTMAGSGVLPGTVSTIVASGLVRALGTGSLAAQVATAPATGLSRWVTAAALQPGPATLSSGGGAVVVGTGTLTSTSLIVSAGISRSFGTGAMPSQVAEFAGYDLPTFLGGILIGQKATMTGTGVTSASGRGDLLPSMAA